MSRTLRFDRELYLPRALVFDAWTQGEHVAQWYPPDGCAADTVVVEAERDGRFEVLWREGGSTVGDAGRFETLERPEGFVCDLGGVRGAARAGLRVRLRLEDLTDACTVTVTLEWRGAEPPDEPVEGLRAIWEARLDRLEAYFSAV